MAKFALFSRSIKDSAVLQNFLLVERHLNKQPVSITLSGGCTLKFDPATKSLIAEYAGTPFTLHTWI